MQTIILPLAPTANHSYATIGNRRVVSRATEEFRREVWLAIKQQKITSLAGRISISIAVYPKTLARMDIDNRIKPLLDAMTIACVWDDDSQIDFISVKRHEVIKGGKMIVVIEEIK